MFSLFSLPENALWRIFDLFNYIELYHLSKCSKQTKELIQLVMPVINSKSEPVVHVMFDVHNFYIRLRKYGPEHRESTCIWNFVPTRVEHHFELDDQNLDEQFRFKNLPQRNVLNYIGHGAHREKVLTQVLAQIMELFFHGTNKNVDILFIRLIGVGDLEPILSSVWLQNSLRIALTGGSVTKEEMTRFLENFGKHSQLDLMGVNPGSDFVFEKQISPETLFINNAKWLSNMSLLSFSYCQLIDIDTPNTFTNINFTFFIRYWLIDPISPRLQYLIVKNCQSPLSQSEITKDFDLYPPRMSQRKTSRMQSKLCNEPWEDGMDMFRSDGLPATFLVKERAEEEGFDVFFSVWPIVFYSAMI